MLVPRNLSRRKPCASERDRIWQGNAWLSRYRLLRPLPFLNMRRTEPSLNHAMPFSASSLRFFRQLAKNNNKPWFEAHRAEYERDVRGPMRELIEEMNARFERFAPEMGGDP